VSHHRHERQPGTAKRWRGMGGTGLLIPSHVFASLPPGSLSPAAQQRSKPFRPKLRRTPPLSAQIGREPSHPPSERSRAEPERGTKLSTKRSVRLHSRPRPRLSISVELDARISFLPKRPERSLEMERPIVGDRKAGGRGKGEKGVGG
jgi:hypothetical protein